MSRTEHCTRHSDCEFGNGIQFLLSCEPDSIEMTRHGAHMKPWSVLRNLTPTG
jgi:hypothetical protein